MGARRVRRAVDAVTLGRRRRVRAMNRRLAELDRVEFGVQWVPRRRPAAASVALVVILLAVISGVVVWETSGSHRGGAGQTLTASTADGELPPAQPIAGAPTKTHLVDLRRLLPAVTSTASSSYRFLYGTRSMRWEPCRPIRYVVRHGGEPKAYDVMLRSAISEVSRATGLEFVFAGSTAEIPPYDGARRPYQPSVYGDQWAPVLIAWSNSGENPRLVGTTEGVAGPIPWGADGYPMRYVSGQVSFNVDGLNLLRRLPEGDELVRTVLLHELGHLVGLAHVHDKTQVMNPIESQVSPHHYAAGDLAGLAQLGDGPCYADY